MAIFKNRKKYTIEPEQIENEEPTIKLTKMAKRELTITVISIFAVLIVSMGSAFAVFTSFDSSKDFNEVTVGTLKISYNATADESGGYGDTINLSGAFPDDDETGKQSKPYRFTIKNEGTLPAEYTVYIKDDLEMIASDKCENIQLNKGLIKISINGGDPVLLTSLVDATGENYIIDTGNLAAGASKTYELRMWITEDAGNEVLGKHYHGKIVIDGREYKSGTVTPDGSGATTPELGELIPVVYNETQKRWEKADITKAKEWYDYDAQKWANAVVVSPEKYNSTYESASAGTEVSMNDILQMYVWVPRYSYAIQGTYGKGGSTTEPGEIDVKFIEATAKNTGDGKYESGTPTDSDWYTPDAFTLGTQQLSGLWVGKFEAGYSGANSTSDAAIHNTSDESSKVIIKPNVYSWGNISVGNIYNTVKGITAAASTFGLSEETYDSHAMKNSEWGAVAYLSQSKYGKYGNSQYTGANKEVYINNYSASSSDRYKTGCSGMAPGVSSSSTCTPYDDLTDQGGGKGLKGPGASTTGNIYGIYDMSGGANEYVMGNYNKTTGNSEFSSSDNWTTTDEKYFNFYTSTTSTNDQYKSHAIGETENWYGDYHSMVDSTYPWFYRGGGYDDASDAGVFGYGYYGAYYRGISFRVVLTLKETA